MSYYFRPEWRKLRLVILDRDAWKCCECGSDVKARNAHVHHKLPRALGGQDVDENLIVGEINRIANNYIKYASWYK